MSLKPLKIGITHGDINGIGYEVILKAFEDPRMAEICTPVIYGSAKIAAFYRKAMELPEVKLVTATTARNAREGEVNIVNVVPEDTHIEPGTLSKTAGEAAFTALEQAVADLRAGDIDALVTAPICKEAIHSESFCFPGHTEYLEASLGEGNKSLMELCTASGLRVALVTTHLPLSKISQSITRENIVEKLTIFNRSLKADFGINAPRIAVLALNPHAGDGGLLGTEETEIIAPAIADACQQQILAFGPYAADGFFGSDAYRHFDGILAMYHDQGLAPFKTMAMDAGVNFTAGLPYVRTSPDHGTGFDIAGKGEASAESMREAIYMAIDIVRNRQRHAAATRNPLRKQYFEKGKDNVVLDLGENNKKE
ncbi:4-hydroxythreonine-4-phosphate dehydrogenase PdxA [Muribaculum caecicola]|uniref:4-hydroxythreonine-4-phosphate dehydrogenase PdxA n=2 Tax=Muribaculum TaxID=1918540 RepID=A0AC61S4G7_9BACT|nr:4-hydroxythreonine-4-phosphate dehydrogenase PdxA [Muribaculum caecicola]THG45969.1 4-hydroxythreonine-4-phosphate dehydrogenase PdxA [Muribaculum caecicola]